MTDPPPSVMPPKTELAIQARLCCRDELICFVETADAVNDKTELMRKDIGREGNDAAHLTMSDGKYFGTCLIETIPMQVQA